MTRDEADSYVKNKRTEMLTEFISRRGRPFSAVLFIKENGRHGFEFAPRAPRTGKKATRKKTAGKKATRKAGGTRKKTPAKKVATTTRKKSAAKSVRRKAPRKSSKSKKSS